MSRFCSQPAGLSKHETEFGSIDEPPCDVWPKYERGARLCAGVAKSPGVSVVETACRGRTDLHQSGKSARAGAAAAAGVR